MLRAASTAAVLALPVGLGAIVGVSAHDFDRVGWVYAVLILSAAVVALAQQTLP